MRKYVLVDIDHTIRASWRRDEMLDGPWDEYHLEAKNDDPIRDMITAVNALEAWGFYVVCLTGCPEKWRQLNTKWLSDNGLQIDELWMRDDNDFSPNMECKLRICTEKFGSEEGIANNVALVIDDNEAVCQKFNEIGVTTLQVFARRSYP